MADRLSLDRFSNRTLRRVGLALILLGIPSAITIWIDQGALAGSVVAFGHLYLGLFVALGLPWLKRQKRT